MSHEEHGSCTGPSADAIRSEIAYYRAEEERWREREKVWLSEWSAIREKLARAEAAMDICLKLRKDEQDLFDLYRKENGERRSKAEAAAENTSAEMRKVEADTKRLDALLFNDRLDLRIRREDGNWSAGDLETEKIVAVERDPRKAIDVFLATLPSQPSTQEKP